MKYTIGGFVKSYGPATATAEVKILELAEGETLSEASLNSLGHHIFAEYKWFFEVMDFGAHQSFKVVLGFVYNGEKIAEFTAFPVYTSNFKFCDSTEPVE